MVGREDVLQSSFQQNWCLWLTFLPKPILSICVGHNTYSVETPRMHSQRNEWFLGACFVQPWGVGQILCNDAAFRDITPGTSGNITAALFSFYFKTKSLMSLGARVGRGLLTRRGLMQEFALRHPLVAASLTLPQSRVHLSWPGLACSVYT